MFSNEESKKEEFEKGVDCSKQELLGCRPVGMLSKRGKDTCT